VAEKPLQRLARLPRIRIQGLEVPVAEGRLARALGLAWLERGQAGPGLLIPRCRSVHTFGMRFPLDLLFLDAELRLLTARADVPPRRIITCRRAGAVLELPAAGGEAAEVGT
jgi:uncharacterized membrane protein (UPF0127 family)